MSMSISFTRTSIGCRVLPHNKVSETTVRSVTAGRLIRKTQSTIYETSETPNHFFHSHFRDGKFISSRKFARQTIQPREWKRAVKGKKEFSVTEEGVTYYFSSVANKELFSKDFKNYEPQYGGWCAYAMGSTGEKVEIDPATFKIIDGKLYLFYNSFFNNTLTTWNKSEPSLKSKADKNWNLIFK
jgi:YHS domain-containing protein